MTNSGQFPPGTSGNSKGATVKSASAELRKVREMCREDAEECMRDLRALRRHAHTPPRVLLAAVELTLTYAFGKAALERSEDAEPPVERPLSEQLEVLDQAAALVRKRLAAQEASMH